MFTEKPVILASGSPRRRELMAQAGFTFTVQTAKGEEKTTKTLPREVVCELSRQKAMEIAHSVQSPCYVIGADTVVACEDRILGKPADEQQAFDMIDMLQGRAHQVYTGVTLVDVSESGVLRETSFSEKTIVHVCPMTPEEIRTYVATGESIDKAGGYGIQGAFCIYVSGIEGDYFNVVGLPVSRLTREFRRFISQAPSGCCSPACPS